jgi:hypothetical protein
VLQKFAKSETGRQEVSFGRRHGVAQAPQDALGGSARVGLQPRPQAAKIGTIATWFYSQSLRSIEVGIYEGLKPGVDLTGFVRLEGFLYKS